MLFFEFETTSPREPRTARSTVLKCANCPTHDECAKLDKTCSLLTRVKARLRVPGAKGSKISQHLQAILGLGFNFPHGGGHCLLAGEDQQVRAFAEKATELYIGVFEKKRSFAPPCP